MLFYSVRGDIDIHTSQQALCQFPSLIQICSEWSTNPLSRAGCEDDSPSCLKRKLQEQYTQGSFLILRRCQRERSSWSNFNQMKYFLPLPQFFFFLFPRGTCRLWRFIRLDAICIRTGVVDRDTQMDTRNLLLGTSHYKTLTPATSAFTLDATPKLNL